MAPRGSRKDRSIVHENWVAAQYGGYRNTDSGAGVKSNGDVEGVIHDDIGWTFECKTTGEPGKPAKSGLVTKLEKLASEAYGIGKSPALAMRFYMPDSSLADNKGFVDLVVKLVRDDIRGD